MKLNLNLNQKCQGQKLYPGQDFLVQSIETQFGQYQERTDVRTEAVELSVETS